MGPESGIVEQLEVGGGLGKEETGNARIVLHQLCEATEERVLQ